VKTRVALLGASGRMGHAISQAAAADKAVEIVARVQRGDDPSANVGGCDVVIDFSHADATEQNCAACVARQKPLVIGTTGHSAAQLEKIRDTAKVVPVLHAANFSIGVNTLFSLARRAAQLLGDGFDIEITETHHRLKKDAPSGTAKRLAEILCEERGRTYEDAAVHGRVGMTGERQPGQIGMHAIRAGDVVGDHTVIFAAPGERVELTHKASSRETFAVGALHAAKWIIGKSAGLYSMEDVLRLISR
jgi:4-hydroxy-tetrahydrodipicolinate reductase